MAIYSHSSYVGTYKQEVLSSLYIKFFATSDITLNDIKFTLQSNYFENDEVQAISVRCYINNVLTDTVEVKKLATYNFSLNDTKFTYNDTFTIQLSTPSSSRKFIISEDVGVDVLSEGHSGILNNSTTMPLFSLQYSYDGSQPYQIDDDINDGYPFISTIKSYIISADEYNTGEILEPKPWWVWKINDDINDGYPFIFFTESENIKLKLFLGKNKELIPLTPMLNGHYLNMFIKKSSS